MIVIIDYKMGNVGSITNMFSRLGQQAVVSSEYAKIQSASHLLYRALVPLTRVCKI